VAQGVLLEGFGSQPVATPTRVAEAQLLRPAMQDTGRSRTAGGNTYSPAKVSAYEQDRRNVATSNANRASSPTQQVLARLPSREEVRQTTHDTVQTAAGMATDLQARAKKAAGEAQRVASDKAVAAGKQLREVSANANKSRKHAQGVIFGMVAWTFQQIKTKGVRVWAVETARSTPDQARAVAKVVRERAFQLATSARALAVDKSFQATAASAAGGAAALGATGGVAGLATGTAIGAAVGLPAAFFTFGLSIPIAAAIGGACGMVTGAAAGGTVGAVGAGAAGYGAYQKRDEIACAVSSGRQQMSNVANKTMSSVNESAAYAKEKAGASAAYAREKAGASAGYVGEQVSALRARVASGGRD